MADDCANGDGLGRLKVLSVREMRQIWPREAQDLARWITSNIEKLNDTLGLQIEIEEAEVPVDNLRLDLAGNDGATQNPVVIEIQFGQSDHDHLGKLITYAAHQEAGVLVWISNEFQTAHRNALEWLNNISGEELSFYGVRLEVFQINHSKPAARFVPCAGPPAGKKALPPLPSPRQQSYQRFWQRFLEYLRDSHPEVSRAKKAHPKSWFFTGAGRSGFALRAEFTGASEFRVALRINVGNKETNELVFDTLAETKAETEQSLGEALRWESLPGRLSCRISIATDGTIDDPPEKLDEVIAWGAEWMAKFRRAFEPRITKLDLSAPA